MASHFSSDTESLRAEIAAAAARMIAEDGTDYGTAKRKAAKQILGNNKVRGDILPDNALIEDEVRGYNALFFSETQPARLLHLRKMALLLMGELSQFQPYLTGAVLNGTAGEHSDIHLHLFVDSAKEVEIFLINKNIVFEVTEAPSLAPRREPVEIVSYMWQQEGIHLTLYPVEDLRSLKTGTNGRPTERADQKMLAALINESET